MRYIFVYKYYFLVLMNITVIANLGRRNDEQLPDERDISGASRGIAKLWNQYK